MQRLGEAEKMRLAGNDEAIPRWNPCVWLPQSIPDFESEQEVNLFAVQDTPPNR